LQKYSIFLKSTRSNIYAFKSLVLIGPLWPMNDFVTLRCLLVDWMILYATIFDSYRAPASLQVLGLSIYLSVKPTSVKCYTIIGLAREVGLSIRIYSKTFSCHPKDTEVYKLLTDWGVPLYWSMSVDIAYSL